MPAVGFAMGDVTLVDLLASKQRLPNYVQSPDFIAIIGGPDARDAALGDAALLRSMGYCVDYPLKNQGFGKQFKDANQKGARFALIYGSDELAKGVVKIRDFATGAEQEFPREALATLAQELLASGFPDTAR
jgi:histidyl-tRNA synthetase